MTLAVDTASNEAVFAKAPCLARSCRGARYHATMPVTARFRWLSAGDRADATTTAAMARAAFVQCEATDARESKLEDLLLRNHAELRPSQQQRAVLGEEVHSLTELLATSDADVQSTLNEVQELNGEAQRLYHDETAHQRR